MTGDELRDKVIGHYTEHVNPGFARLVSFAGFGVEVSAQGCMITDQDGREFLDFLGGYGVFALGHRHPKVVEAVKRQLDQMPLSGKAFFNEAQGELAARLAAVAPQGLQFTFFSNSGAEAVECALKLAKAATRRTKIIATDGGYHGKTLGALSVTGRDKYRAPFEPLMPGGVFVPYGDASAIDQAIDENTAAVIIEPVQGEGGIHVPPAGYLRSIRRACDRVGALMIADEVQTCLGRTGKLFGCEHDSVSPDILTLAKALGGGVMPIGATMGTPEVWSAVFGENPLVHTSTFGGNALACAAGLAALDVIEHEGLVEQSRLKGGRLKDLLSDVAREFPELVADVRGVGLMVGLEFAMDDVGELVVGQMLKRGLVAAYTLNNRRVIRFEPPLIVSDSQIETAATVVQESIAETAELLVGLA